MRLLSLRSKPGSKTLLAEEMSKANETMEMKRGRKILELTHVPLVKAAVEARNAGEVQVGKQNSKLGSNKSQVSPAAFRRGLGGRIQASSTPSHVRSVKAALLLPLVKTPPSKKKQASKRKTSADESEASTAKKLG